MAGPGLTGNDRIDLFADDLSRFAPGVRVVYFAALQMSA